MLRKCLMVAEKPSVARAIANLLSESAGSELVRVVDHSQSTNTVFQFMYPLKDSNGEPTKFKTEVLITSVRGHIATYKTPDRLRAWRMDTLNQILQDPLEKNYLPQAYGLVQSIYHLSEGIDQAVLWLDCDKEGEAIAYDVRDVILEATELKKSDIKRAHFSALTSEDIVNAVENLGELNPQFRDAVSARQQIDLRLGAAFTRLQTLVLSNQMEAISLQKWSVLSYGPCQFPTLGFVVEREEERANFKPKSFYSLKLECEKVQFEKSKKKFVFDWASDNLDSKKEAALIAERLNEADSFEIKTVETKTTGLPRPLPLNTVNAQKLISTYLKMSSDLAMEYLEKLYNMGLISYPRTETDIFHPTMDLKQITGRLNGGRPGNLFDEYAKEVLHPSKWGGPRQGSNDDKAHPPIHPLRIPKIQDLEEFEKSNGRMEKVYNFVLRHFLACVSKDAFGEKTVVKVEADGETFVGKGLVITSSNFLDIYLYKTWEESTAPKVEEGDSIDNFEVVVHSGKTQPPPKMSEAELISIMDKNGIGTDATIHQHIKTVQDRKYVIKRKDNVLEPTILGKALVNTYKDIDIDLYKPRLRAQMESDMKAISDSLKTKEEVLNQTLEQMGGVFNQVLQQKEKLFSSFKEHINPDLKLNSEIFKSQKTKISLQETLRAMAHDTDFMGCPECKKGKLTVKPTKKGSLFYGCTNFPDCKEAGQFPFQYLEELTMLDEQCVECSEYYGAPVKMFDLKFYPEFAETLGKYKKMAKDGKMCLNNHCKGRDPKVFNNFTKHVKRKARVFAKK